MAQVHFTSALKRFFPNLTPTQIPATSVQNLIEDLETNYPGLKNYLLLDNGQLRQHVNIFINGELIQDTQHLSDALNPHDEVYILQALSGG